MDSRGAQLRAGGVAVKMMQMLLNSSSLVGLLLFCVDLVVHMKILLHHLQPHQSIFAFYFPRQPELIGAILANIDSTTSIMFFQFGNAFSEMLGLGQATELPAIFLVI